jgi:hypothetical protein
MGERGSSKDQQEKFTEDAAPLSPESITATPTLSGETTPPDFLREAPHDPTRAAPHGADRRISHPVNDPSPSRTSLSS